MLTHHQLQKIQMRRGWHVAIDGEQFRVVSNGRDEKYRRVYTLRDQEGEQRTMLRASALDLMASGRLRVTTPVEAALIGKIDLIRDYAKRGYSMSGTAKALGLYGWDVRRAIELCGADDIEFAKGTDSVTFRENLVRLHAGLRGRSKEIEASKSRANSCGRSSALPLTQKDIDLARYYAKRGHSFSFTAQLLGISNGRLRRLLAGTDIQFVNGNQSLAQKKRLADLHEGQRGQSLDLSNESRAAMLRGGEKGREKRCTKYTAFGVNAYLPDLVVRFGVVSLKSVRARLKRGMAIEEAITKPYKPSPRGVIPPQFVEQVAKQRREAAARIRAIITKRITPTMLQFRSPDHEIVATHCKDASVTVEVRAAGAVLHRLKFVKTFDSGVLFVFNATEQGRFDFIAFEPDSPALVSSNQ